MDHSALQAQIAANLQYAGTAFTYPGGTVYGSLETVSIEDAGVEVTYQGQGFRLTYSREGLATAPRAGDTLTTATGRYRILTEPTTHPTANTAECIVEEISNP